VSLPSLINYHHLFTSVTIETESYKLTVAVQCYILISSYTNVDILKRARISARTGTEHLTSWIVACKQMIFADTRLHQETKSGKIYP